MNISYFLLEPVSISERRSCTVNPSGKIQSFKSFVILGAKMSLPASNGKTVLLTGINGYIASVLGQLLLSKGYSLRGTTRRKASADSLISGPYAPYAERVRVFEIPDVTIEGAFDEAATGQLSILSQAIMS